jgi:hypothetical protein
MKQLNLPEFNFSFKDEKGKKFIFDEIRRKFITLTPEEWVRQNFVKYLINNKNYPASLIALEVPLVINETDQRSDIVAYNKNGRIVVLVECKSPEISLTQKVFDQAAGYNLKLNAKILIITNGIAHYCCKPDYSVRRWIFLDDIPDYKELGSISMD